MSTFFLINTVSVGTTKIFAGDLINDATEDTAPIIAAGGLLWPSSDATIAAAALKARNARLNRGADEKAIDAIMQQGVDTVQMVSDATTVPNTTTLTAGAGLTGGGDLSANRTFDVGANADGSILANAGDVQVGVLATDAQHGVRGGGTQHATATTTVAGFESAADKVRFEGLFSVANKAALALVDGSTLDDHVSRYVVTYQQWWLLDKTSALTLVNDMIIAAVGGGRWLRQIEHAPKWTNQITWGVDTGAGNDENSGADSVGNRLLTVTEVARRLAAFNFTDYTINVIGTVAATDTPRFTGFILSGGPASIPQMLVNINGVRTPVAGFPGGTIGVATATDVATTPSTGLSQAMITDAAVADWTPYADPATTSKSKLLVITSGPNAGLTAWTLFANPAASTSVLNGGVDVTRVRVSNWQNATAAAIGATAAGAAASAAVVAALSGQTYSINDLSPYLAPNTPTVGSPERLQVTYKDFEFSASLQSRGSGVVNLTTTKHTGPGGGTGSFFAAAGGQLNANGSLVHFSALATIAGGNAPGYNENGCAFINAQLIPLTGTTWRVSNITLQSSIVVFALAGGTVFGGPERPGVLGMMSVNGAYGMGIYDPPTAQNGITVRRGGIFATESVLHGFGAVAGSLFFAAVDDGGTMLIKTGIVPTGTNTGGQVKLDGAVTALQALEAAIPGVQVGTDTLVAGTKTVSALISATSRIKVSLNTPIGAAIGSNLAAPSASRVVGSPGSFIVNGVDTTGATVATDASTFDWEVVNDPPIGVPLSTWAQWTAAVVPHISGFARNVISQTDGSKIIDFTGAN